MASLKINCFTCCSNETLFKTWPFAPSSAMNFTNSNLMGKSISLSTDQRGFINDNVKAPTKFSVRAQGSICVSRNMRWWEKTLKPNMIEIHSGQQLVDSLSNAGDRLVIVDFYSPGCGGCKALHPKIEGIKSKRAQIQKMKALPDITLMAVLVEHMEGQRDMITHKSIFHLSDAVIKNVYTFYIMFTCWGCCFFGSTKDPYYDSEQYRKDGGDGTGHWVYEKQEDIEEKARAALWREELIEEIEQKVGGLRELEEASKEEELVR